MPIRFVLGRAGTGKTQHCLDSVRKWSTEKGIAARSFFLVPRQATFNAERTLACADGAQSLLNVRVVSFESLTRELAIGMEAEDVFVSPRGRRMIISQILHTHASQLHYFRDTATQPHLAAKLDTVLAEIQQELIPVDTIDEILQANEGTSGQATAGKLHDLKLIAGEYDKYLGQDKLDPVKRLQNLEEQIRQSDLVQDALIVADGFAGFTAMQIRLLIALAKKCQRLDLCLLMDPDDPQIRNPRRKLDDYGLFARTRRTYARLHRAFKDAGVTIESPLLLRQQHRFRSPPLQAIERQWESEHPKPVRSDRTEVLVMEATDLQQEVVFAARQIRKWQIQDVRLREIGILTRNIEPYHAAIRRVFAEHNIATFIDRRRELSSHPLIRYVRAILGITQRGWRQQFVVELLKTGLSGLNPEETDFLENFALKHGIDGIAWIADQPWQFTQSPAAEDEPSEDETQQNARAEVLRRKLTTPIQNLVRSLREPKKVREHVANLYELLCCQEHNVRTTLGQWMQHEQKAERPEAAQEHRQAWKQIIDLLDDAVRFLGENEQAGEHFVQTIEAGLEEIDLALTPPTLDQVTVGQIDRSRSPDLRKLIVMGLNEGAFPAIFTEDPIFSDAERRAMEERDLELTPDSSRQILAENMLGYIAMTRASETLVLTRPLTTGEGRETSPSIFLDRILKIVSPVDKRRAGDGGVENITSPDQAAVAIVQHAVRKVTGTAGADSKQVEELWDWILRQPANSPVAGPTNLAMPGLFYANAAKVSSQTLEQLYTNPLSASVSRLETFAACPFKHFASYVLKLREREVAELSNLDLGNAFHFVLERMVRQIVARQGTWKNITDAQIDELADDVANQLRRQLLLSSARNRYLLSHIKSTLRRVLRDQQISESAGEFRPLGAEIEFGVGGRMGPLEITTPKTNQTLLLRGKIDRIDWVEEQLRVAVYDYKTHRKRVELKRVLNGLTLQLLAYLLVLEDRGKDLVGKQLTPAGAFYVELLRRMESAKLPGDPLADDEVESRPDGIFRQDLYGYFDGDTSPGKSKVMNARRKNDGELYKNGSAYTPEQFDTLLTEVRRILGELAEQMLEGIIRVEPYRLNKSTPCEYCEYRAVCRMDPALNDYRPINTTSERELRAQLFDETEGEE